MEAAFKHVGGILCATRWLQLELTGQKCGMYSLRQMIQTWFRAVPFANIRQRVTSSDGQLGKLDLLAAHQFSIKAVMMSAISTAKVLSKTCSMIRLASLMLRCSSGAHPNSSCMLGASI
mmetsp:Transcript_29150/g.61955  ORF Transcript_29150/g.61955 Transcript_29150/m.61955 type:complete len:119 (+) Transcript_29150:916-1272(+)